MVMPIDVVLVRHGESEGNLAHARQRAGDNSSFENQEFRSKHSSQWRLTKRGRKQALAAGQWIKDNIFKQFDNEFDSFFCSEYTRAMETAALLNLPEADWLVDFHLRERDWGALDPLSHEERKKHYLLDLERRKLDSFYWCPSAGESLATVCLRLSKIISRLHRECHDKRVVIVCHGEVMWAFRVIFERLSQQQYRELDKSQDVKDKIHNCQIIHYSRRDPKTGKLHNTLKYMKSVCPWDLSKSHNTWVEFKKKKMSNTELLKIVNFTPVHLHNTKEEIDEWTEKYEMYTPVNSKKKLEKMFEITEEDK